ncbi:CDP-glycerol glycerophosphotransferase family protein [Sediminibacter sp. Hel_I_10]|uniref:CDP-glycerol glycerophosphotransferase family protein n=1 Tax=Sediminibacter sp. Hel_I_10 TaxID=1392490 RepID=UPI00047E2C96|nr:CDP-glycerol glycerophosphotransferase family protein [Sediminibacter sp. Hel_I_10]
MHYKFLIYISYSYAVPIGNPLETEILSRDYDIMWFSDLEDGKKALSHKSNQLITINEVVDYKPHIVLAATNDVPDFIYGLKVQIFHGFNAEKRPEGKNSFTHFRIRGFFDLYCTQGPSTTNGFKKTQKQQPHFEVKETGWSKVDPLFPMALHHGSEQPTIMIASTFTKRLSLAYRDDVFLEIERLSKSDTFKFIMVLHPKLPDDIKLKWKSLDSNNFSYFDTTDLVPLFKKADLLFADTTSAIQEFLIQKKPVVTFNHTFDHDYLINVTTAQAIETAFEEALSYPEDLIANISTFVNQLHPYFDGKSSARVIDTCIAFLHQEKSHLKNKPLNLIRKYKIRKRLGYFTLKSYNTPFTIKL